MVRITLILLMFIAGCATRPPHPDEITAKQFQPAPGKAVIYVYRERQDFSAIAAPIAFGNGITGATYPGTFYRWEAVPGAQEIRGFGVDMGALRLNVEAGKVYFIQQTVWSSRSSASSTFRLVDERLGRDGVTRAELISLL